MEPTARLGSTLEGSALEDVLDGPAAFLLSSGGRGAFRSVASSASSRASARAPVLGVFSFAEEPKDRSLQAQGEHIVYVEGCLRSIGVVDGDVFPARGL